MILSERMVSSGSVRIGDARRPSLKSLPACTWRCSLLPLRCGVYFVFSPEGCFITSAHRYAHNGVPSHSIRVKKGVAVMLTRNLSIDERLTNMVLK